MIELALRSAEVDDFDGRLEAGDGGQVEVHDTTVAPNALTPQERQQAMLAALLTIAAKGQEILEAQERAEAGLPPLAPMPQGPGRVVEAG